MKQNAHPKRRLVGTDPSRRAFQFFSLFRFATLFGMAIGLARIFPDQGPVADYERLLLIGSSISFFWVGGLNDAFLVLFRKMPAPQAPQLLSPSQSIHRLAAFSSALLLPLLALLIYPGVFEISTLVAFAAFTLGDTYSLQVVYLYLAERKSRPMLVFTITAYLLQAAALLVPILITGNLQDGIFGLGAFGLAKGIVAHLLIQRPKSGEASPREQRQQLIKIALPLMGAALLSHSATYLDSFLVESWFPESFANFRYGAKELPLVLLLANALSISQSGNIAEAHEKAELGPKLDGLSRSTLRLIHPLFLFSIILLMASRPLFGTVLGEDFFGAVPIFDIYLLLVIPRLLFPQSILRGFGETKYLAYSAGVELGLNVVLSIVGLLTFGVEGIAMATVIAFFVEKIILMAVLQRKHGIKWAAYSPVGMWSAYSIALLGLWGLKTFFF